MKNIFTLFIITISSFLSVIVAGNSTIEIKQGMYQVDGVRKLIIVNQPVTEINNIIEEVILDAAYELQAPVNQFEIGKAYMITKVSSEERYTLYFTELPIINITTDHIIADEPRVLAHFTITESDGNTLSSNIGIEFRGASSQSYPKKSFRVEFWEGEDDTETKDVSLLGMRSDDDWNLQAMYNEPLRIRSKTSNDLWRMVHTLYYEKKEPEAINGIRMKYSELFLNGEYRGVYCVSERVDRKQFKLKKYKDDVRGELYKGVGWGASTYEKCPPYDNSKDLWSGFEYDYPDEIPIDWSRLHAYINFVVNSSDEDFLSQYPSWVETSNMIDYFIFLNLLRATDNTGKNLYVAKYKEGEPYFFIPWDLDGVFGIIWSGDQQNITDDILTNRLFERLRSDKKFKDNLNSQWRKLRDSNVITTNNLMGIFNESYNYLKNNAVYEREAIAWEYNFDAAQLTYMEEWMKARISYLDIVFSYDTGITKHSGDEISIYPNPSSDFISIKGMNEPVNVEIFNMNGELIKSVILNGSDNKISTNNLVSGIYMISLTGSDYNKTMKLIIKK